MYIYDGPSHILSVYGKPSHMLFIYVLYNKIHTKYNCNNNSSSEAKKRNMLWKQYQQ